MPVTLEKGSQRLKIDAGELIGYQFQGREYIHQKGSPGWGNSDIEMFPIIGPTAKADFRVHVPKGNAIQDQHGLLRELAYEQISNTTSTAVFLKKYKAGSLVRNSKYPEKSTAQWLIWPFSFEFQKTYRLIDEGLEISFSISGDRDMPYMLGYHPAFKIHSENPIVSYTDGEVSLDEIRTAGDRALPILACNEITLLDAGNIMVRTEGFKHFMLWTPSSNMLCIEPITFYPYEVDQQQLHEGFDYLGDTSANFTVNLIPGSE